MTKFYLTVLASILSLSVFSQAFTINKTYSPTTLDKYTSYFLSKTTAPGAGGAAQTWDFSTVKQDSSFNSLAIAVPANRKAAYPFADVAQVSGYGDTTFYQVGTGTELTNWGYYSAFLGSTKYTDGQVIIKYDLKFNDTFKDSIKGTSSIKYQGAKLETTRKGEGTVTYDGWGSLSLPGGKIYPKVARIKSVLTGVDVPKGFPNQFASTITSYFWYAEGINYPVLTITAITSSLANDQIVIQSGTYEPNAVMDKTFANSIIVAPNPVHDRLNLQFSTTGNGAKVTCKDPSGRTHFSYSITAGNSGNASLDISTLTPGIYFLEIESNGLMAVKKIYKN